MAKIQELLDNLLRKKLGRDVRQSIHDSIEQCYKDATGHPDSVAAVIKENKEMQEHLNNTPYMFLEEEEEKDLPVHTINDGEISEASTWSSKKINKELTKYKLLTAKKETIKKDGSITVYNIPLPNGYTRKDIIVISCYMELYNENEGTEITNIDYRLIGDGFFIQFSRKGDLTFEGTPYIYVKLLK